MIGLLLSVLAGVASPPNLVQPDAPDAPDAPGQLVVPRAMYTAPLPPLAPDRVPAVRATANLPSLFSTDDYPAAALRGEQQGTVAFAVAIDPGGRVTACSVTKGSGAVMLDWATCSIIQRRARYTPARDAAGNLVEDRAEGRIRWVLPQRPPLPYADYRLALVYTSDATGSVTACRLDASTDAPADNRLCALTMPQAHAMARAAAKRFDMTNRELVVEQGLLVGGAERARGIGTRPGEARGTMLMLALEIDAAGVITHCTGADGNEEEARVAAACADSAKRKFLPSGSVAASRSTRHAVRYFASYTRPTD